MKFNGTFGLPSLDFDEEKGLIKIFGRSIAVEAIEDFYKPLKDKLEDYLSSPRDITMAVELEFISTSSAKALLELFMICSRKVVKEHKNVFTIEWIYEDEDDLEVGEDYQDVLPLATFKFIEK
jgi:hypothetical protein